MSQENRQEYEPCPKCGMDVPIEDVPVIEEDMEYTQKVCIVCDRTFEEVHEELFGDESD